MKHKHAEVIHAWADDPSQIVQVRKDESGWEDLPVTPSWNRDLEYRLKPDPRAARDMAIAKAVRDECGGCVDDLSLGYIIASVKD